MRAIGQCVNWAMCQFGNGVIRQWGNVAMWQCGNSAIRQCVNGIQGWEKKNGFFSHGKHGKQGRDASFGWVSRKDATFLGLVFYH